MVSIKTIECFLCIYFYTYFIFISENIGIGVFICSYFYYVVVFFFGVKIDIFFLKKVL